MNEINIHEGHRERLRKKFNNDIEFKNFAPHEMLEFVLFAGIPRKDTNTISHELIKYFGSFHSVFYATPDELMKIPNMTKAAAYNISSIISIARQIEIQRNSVDAYIDSINSAVVYLHSFFKNRITESVYMICIDNNDKVINNCCICDGDVNFAILDTKKIVLTVSRNGAKKVILGHNHPAGTLNPSPQDIIATTRLVATLSGIGVIMLDHIIFTSTGYFSFNQNRIIETIYQNCDKAMGTDILKEYRERKKNLNFGELDKYVFEDNFKFIDFNNIHIPNVIKVEKDR